MTTAAKTEKISSVEGEVLNERNRKMKPCETLVKDWRLLGVGSTFIS